MHSEMLKGSAVNDFLSLVPTSLGTQLPATSKVSLWSTTNFEDFGEKEKKTEQVRLSTQNAPSKVFFPSSKELGGFPFEAHETPT